MMMHQSAVVGSLSHAGPLQADYLEHGVDDSISRIQKPLPDEGDGTSEITLGMKKRVRAKVLPRNHFSSSASA